jgi:hypothetical protein
VVQFAAIPDEQLIDGWKCKPIPAETFGVNRADRAWVDRQCTVQPLACFRQPAQLTGGLAQISRIAYAFASGWAGGQSTFYPFYQQAKARGWTTSVLDCGHDAMLDRPEAVTALLLNSL